mgnify:FL=1
MLRDLEREKRILEKIYYDRMDGYRYRLVKDADSEETRQERVQIYENRRCALSLSGNDAPEEGTITDSSTSKYTLFADPGIQLQENDVVVIRTASGPVYEGRSGRTYVVLNHGETPVKIEKSV